jgi:hypothetical protein
MNWCTNLLVQFMNHAQKHENDKELKTSQKYALVIRGFSWSNLFITRTEID